MVTLSEVAAKKITDLAARRGQARVGAAHPPGGGGLLRHVL
jgi:hypothetical protein